MLEGILAEMMMIIEEEVGASETRDGTVTILLEDVEGETIVGKGKAEARVKQTELHLTTIKLKRRENVDFVGKKVTTWMRLIN